MNKSFRRLYQQLYRHFGPQGWWPTTPRGETRPRYHLGTGRRTLEEREQWEIIVGAILTQNTSWHNVEQALAALSARQALDLPALLALDVDELAELIRPSRYFNQKAHRLQDIARYIDENYRGSTAALLRRPAVLLRRELLSLKGIGPETADSILLYAAQYPFFVVDAYTRRIFFRHNWCRVEEGYDDLKSMCEAALDCFSGDRLLNYWGDWHAQLVMLGKTHCHAKSPDCENCPLKPLLP